MAKTVSLIISAPEAEPIHYRLSDDQVSLGRAKENRVVIDVNAVSSRHCHFKRSPSGGYRVVDVGSTNGTRVNGQKVMDSAGVALKNGDRILLGETVEAHFIEAIDGEIGSTRPSPEKTPRQSLFSEDRPAAVWVDASEAHLAEEDINPVAAAVARQQEAASEIGSSVH